LSLIQPVPTFANHSAFNSENSAKEFSPAQSAQTLNCPSAFHSENPANKLSPAQPVASQSALNPENSLQKNASKTINDLLTSLFRAQNQLNYELERIKCFLEQLPTC
jgi:hypothetical protein